MNGTEERNPVVSVVIVTWNAKKYVDLCLKSLAQPTRIPIEVILVDNGSTDGTPELVADRLSSFILIQNGHNYGFAKANNIGIQRCRGKIICLVNSDVIVPPGCFEALAEYMEKNPDIGMLGPQMLSPNGVICRSAMRTPSLRSAVGRALGIDGIPIFAKIFKSQLMADFAHNQVRDVDILNGWFWVVRREALDDVGLLDERFFMYGEDMDWCDRFRQAGWRRVFYPNVSAIHFGGGSSRVQPVRFYLEQKRADFQYWQKHHGLIGQKLFWLLTLIHSLVRITGFLVTYVFRPKRRDESIAKIERSWALIGWMLGIRELEEKNPAQPLATA